MRLGTKIAWSGVALCLFTGITSFVIWKLDKLDIIDRFSFEWGDFATLTTGMLAVIGAVLVGMRQVAITDRQANISEQQTKILDRQIALQSLSLKADLYDKRVKVYSDVKRYARSIWSTEEFRDANNTRDFLIALESSRFLFNERVHEIVREIYNDCIKFSSVAKSLETLERSSSPSSDMLLNKQSDLSDEIHDHITTLTDLIMPYMRVDEHDYKSDE